LSAFYKSVLLSFRSIYIKGKKWCDMRFKSYRLGHDPRQGKELDTSRHPLQEPSVANKNIVDEVREVEPVSRR